MPGHNRTAYEEALFQEGLGEDAGANVSAFGMPSYMVAADSHNLANGNKTFSESVMDTVQDVPKFVATSLISGANQIYNAPASIGNMFGADYDVSGPDDFIASLDSNLGDYYQEHKEGVDLVGFLASSWIPGMGGIKALHAGQAALKSSITAGKFGENTSKALGLLIPNKQRHLTKALREAVNSNSVPSLINRNVLSASGAGLTQATYEAAAFELAVAATMSSSPILEGQDLGDFATNVAWGAGLFGVISGGAGAIKSYYATRNIVKLADRQTSPWRYAKRPAGKADPYEVIAIDLLQLGTTPRIPKAGLKVGETETVIDATTLAGYAKEKVAKIENDIRKQVGIIAGGDEDVAEAIYTASIGATPMKRMSAFIGMKGASRVLDVSTTEKELGKLRKLIRGKGEGALEAAERAKDLNIAYTRLWGVGAGDTITSIPKITSITDTLKKGQKVSITPAGVSAGSNIWKFDLKETWSVLKSDPLAANARHLWAQSLDKFHTPTVKRPVIINEFDIPLMEKAYREFDIAFQFRAETGELYTYGSAEAFFDKLTTLKKTAGNNLADAESQAARLKRTTKIGKATKGKIQEERNIQLSQEEIEAMVNVKPGYLSGTITQDVTADTMALQSYAEEYTKDLVERGIRKPEAGIVDLTKLPQTVKLTYDTKDLTGLTRGHVVENMVRIKELQKFYMQGTTRAFNGVVGDEARNFGEITAAMIQDSANRISTGVGIATAGGSENYGTLASFVSYVGKATIRTIEKAKDSVRGAVEPALYKLGQNTDAAIEYVTLSNILRSIPDNYALNEAGDAMVNLALLRWEKAAAIAIATNKTVPKRPVPTAIDAPTSIPIKNSEVTELIRIEHETNKKVIGAYRELRTSQGTPYTRDGEAYYPIPVNPKDYKHFALVYDKSITGTGHTKTLYAATADELQAMAKKLDNDPNLDVRFKGDAEEYYKSRGQFEYEKTLSDNYLDAAMYRKGVSSSYFVPTDPQKIINDTLNWHLQRTSGLVREAVAVKYEVPFAELRRLGESFTKGETSQFTAMSTLKYAEDAIKNPYVDFIKTSLGIRKYSDYPFLVETNKLVDRAFTNMFDKVSNAVEGAKTPKELAQVNEILTESGYKGAAYDETMDLFANHQARKGLLTSTVQKANSILTATILRWDPLNAINNAVSANVLLGAETAAVMRAINAGDKEAIGALAKLTRLNVPGTDRTIISSGKMIANSMKKFGTKTPEMEFYKKHGYITSISDQYRNALDDLTFNPKETVQAWNKRVDAVHKTLREAANTGEKWTGNRLAEEFNRFVAADVMKQMTDIGVTKGLITSQQQLAYINTFVNRTQGNYLAAQRPMMFQGPIGQAIGLFQTYQFNLMQQLFRHIGEGTIKDSMSLLALQGTIHGMNGLPAFNAINTHIVGNASGNTEHRDIYDTTYGIVGKQAGNWLMYGAASNMLLLPDLKVNLYTRGDINPRHLTIVPTDPSQVPIVQATAKFFKNIFEVADKLAAGGDVSTTILQGIEHNGISRPLAGLAQTLEALDNPMAQSYSTSNRGNVIASNDFFSLVNLGRIAGGKPLDEAIAIDASFRFKSYGLGDMRKRQNLGEAVRTTLIAGKEPSMEQIDNFAEQYVATGGKQEQFNSWFLQQYKTANLSQANKLAQDLNSPFSQSMQKIMGGYELRDFTE
jgi:hypothetical protein